jgi:hypothetical protein
MSLTTRSTIIHVWWGIRGKLGRWISLPSRENRGTAGREEGVWRSPHPSSRATRQQICVWTQNGHQVLAKPRHFSLAVQSQCASLSRRTRHVLTGVKCDDATSSRYSAGPYCRLRRERSRVLACRSPVDIGAPTAALARAKNALAALCLHRSRAKGYTIFNINTGAVSLPL